MAASSSRDGESLAVQPKLVATVTTPSELPENEYGNDEFNRHLLRKIDLRLCTIAGILCSLNLLDSGIISSAAVTSMPQDLGLTGNRFSVAIFIFTVASICAQLPATIIMRFVGPPIFFSCTTVCFGLITLCTAFISSWRQMIALRVLLGVSMSGIYPGLTYLISAWYARRDQQLRFAFLQSGEVIILATGSIVNFGLNQLGGQHSLAGWRWMYIVQGSITMVLGLLTFLWIPHFPESAGKTIRFLTTEETDFVLAKIDRDRRDAGKPEPFTTQAILKPFLDPKLYAFAVLFFLLNLVSTALSYFLPIILQSGMGFSANKAILLSAPPYYYAVIPVIATSLLGDKFRVRGPIIIFNAVCLIVGFCMLGFPSQVTVRYVGTFLATGAYVSNWAALSTYQANNITGQWKRATVAAAVSACNGLGGIAGSYIVRSHEAPKYITAIWVSIGSHLLMICLVLICTAFFWRANRRARKGNGIIEGVTDFRYTY
ncbi:hypothetical protein H2198_004591 [Neophaeococcomyces mojaviensis]|uniref:Uncharacterized protein n=1 Tax=Neophaeococcomyces mojaviensis TaxID=3383035 RepID=A0ACC3A813_9EURO|nr:hypothetical protein H2198_004591 [Knufia sp. JES_112]